MGPLFKTLKNQRLEAEKNLPSFLLSLSNGGLAKLEALSKNL